MALLALIIHVYTAYASLERSFANCVHVYTIKRAYARAYIYMRVHLYPREFVFVYTQTQFLT